MKIVEHKTNTYINIKDGSSKVLHRINVDTKKQVKTVAKWVRSKLADTTVTSTVTHNCLDKPKTDIHRVTVIHWKDKTGDQETFNVYGVDGPTIFKIINQ